MSRFTIIALLVSALSSSASARALRPHFAEAPTPVASVPTTMPDDMQLEPVALDRDTVRAALLKARQANLASFRTYQQMGVFPSNTYVNGQLNVWRDQDGHFCAAATIIRLSGKTDLVNKVADQNNFIRLADVRQGPLMDWILTSGFTQDEIAMIQAPFQPVTEQPSPEPAPINMTMREKETARLVAKYATISKLLVKNQKKSLDLAVDRLMKHPQLAWALIEG